MPEVGVTENTAVFRSYGDLTVDFFLPVRMPLLSSAEMIRCSGASLLYCFSAAVLNAVCSMCAWLTLQMQPANNTVTLGFIAEEMPANLPVVVSCSRF